MNRNPDTQLEWFDLSPKGTAKPRQTWWVIEPLRVRADHAVLALIMTLVTGSVVFAVGIERGKTVARSERRLETMATSVDTVAPAPKMAPSALERKSLPAAPSKASTPSTAPKAVPGMKRPAKSVAAERSERSALRVSSAAASQAKYAIQVVSYSQPKLAQQELQRLQQRGEDAFLIMVKDRTVLMVGPYGSRDRASAKLSSLKQQYRDCFVRSL